MTVKLYKITRHDRAGYDTYISAIVAATDEWQARRIHPHGEHIDWVNDRHWYEGQLRIKGWPSPDDVLCECVGATDTIPARTVVLASFNAG